MSHSLARTRVSSAAQSNAPSPGPADDDNDSDEEFVYPGVSEAATSEPLRNPSPPAESLVPSLPQSASSRDVSQEPEEPSQPPPAPKPTKTHPSPAQLESLQAAASSGDLSLLQKLFRTALQTGDVEPFALANDASPRTGLTALHAASSRGYLDIVKWRASHCSCHAASTNLRASGRGMRGHPGYRRQGRRGTNRHKRPRGLCSSLDGRLLSTRLHCMDTSLLSPISYLGRRTSIHETTMAGRPYIMHARRYALQRGLCHPSL